jgi:hypothetical protein
MQDKELYQHILGLTSPWSVVPARRASEGNHLHHFANEEPLLARRAGTARQAAQPSINVLDEFATARTPKKRSSSPAVGWISLTVKPEGRKLADTESHDVMLDLDINSEIQLEI